MRRSTKNFMKLSPKNSSIEKFNRHPSDPFAPENFHKLRFAHRGGYVYGPENTLKTIQTAFSNGVNAIEIDLQLTANNQLVLFHDDTVERILNCNYPFEVYDLTLRELQSIPLRHESNGTQYVCSFRELLTFLSQELATGRRTNFMIELEIKGYGNRSDRTISELTKILEEFNPAFGGEIYNHFFVSTFYNTVLDSLQKRNPQLKIAIALMKGAPFNKILAYLAIVFTKQLIKKYNISIVEPNLALASPRYLKKWKKRGILLNVYTANTQGEKEYLKQYNVAYTTNCPFGVCNCEESDQMANTPEWIQNFSLT